MKKQTVGLLIRHARMKKKMDRKQAAKKIGISSGYLAILERDGNVRLSDRLVGLLTKKLGASKRLGALQDGHNRRAKKVYANYPSARA